MVQTMRDCPACRVPLHGYEEVCPSCGTKQFPTRSARGPYGTNFKPQEPTVNWLPFVLVFVGVGIFLLVAMQGTWIGQIMRGENKQPEDPIAKMSYVEARNTIETQLNQGLAAVGATNTKISWHSTSAPAAAPGAAATDDRNVDGPVELTVDTNLPDKEMRKQVIDPVKPYMEPGKVFSLTMNDAKSRAHWTYNLQATTSPVEPDAGLE